MARSSTAKSIAVRLATEGGHEVKRDFDQIADSGKRAFDTIDRAAKNAKNMPAIFRGLDTASRLGNVREGVSSTGQGSND